MQSQTATSLGRAYFRIWPKCRKSTGGDQARSSLVGLKGIAQEEFMRCKGCNSVFARGHCLPEEILVFKNKGLCIICGMYGFSPSQASEPSGAVEASTQRAGSLRLKRSWFLILSAAKRAFRAPLKLISRRPNPHPVFRTEFQSSSCSGSSPTRSGLETAWKDLQHPDSPFDSSNNELDLDQLLSDEGGHVFLSDLEDIAEVTETDNESQMDNTKFFNLLGPFEEIADWDSLIESDDCWSCECPYCSGNDADDEGDDDGDDDDSDSDKEADNDLQFKFHPFSLLTFGHNVLYKFEGDDAYQSAPEDNGTTSDSNLEYQTADTAASDANSEDEGTSAAPIPYISRASLDQDDERVDAIPSQFNGIESTNQRADGTRGVAPRIFIKIHSNVIFEGHLDEIISDLDYVSETDTNIAGHDILADGNFPGTWVE